jgi:plastocyanin
MINTAAKLSFALAAVAVVMGAGYGIVVQESAGTTILLAAGVAALLAGAAFLLSGATDRAKLVGPDTPLETVSVDRSLLTKPSPWPLVATIAATLFAVGAATGQVLIIIGLIAGLLAAVGWTAQDWEEHPTSTRAVQSRVIERFVMPIGTPLMVFALVAVIVISISRVLLAVNKDASVAVALGLAAVFLVAFFLISARPPAKSTMLVGLAAVTVLALVAAGSVGAAKGERKFEEHVPPPTVVSLTAQGIKYSKTVINIKADTDEELIFTNRDGGTYHNVAFYTSETGGTPLFNGQPVQGPKKITYHVHVTQPGTYAFRCDFHPTMVGQLVVGS